MKIKMDSKLQGYIISELTQYRNYIAKREQRIKDIATIDAIADSDGSQKTNAISNVTERKALNLIDDEELNLLNSKIENIKNAYLRLKPWEIDVAESIFDKGHTYQYMEIHEGIGQKVYYTVRKKLIYYVAKEYKLI